MQHCLNCHQSEETPPHLLGFSALLNEGNPGADRARAEDYVSFLTLPPEPCSAEAHWPERLREDLPALRSSPGWARSNYEAARQAGRSSLPPFRLRGVNGDLDLRLIPRNFSYRLFGQGGSGAYDVRSLGVRVMPAGEIRSHLSLRNDEIPWDVRGLLEFHNIRLDGPLFFNYLPTRVLPDGEGNLCLYAAHNMTYSLPSGWRASNPPADRWALRWGDTDLFFTGGEAPRFCDRIPQEFHQPPFDDAPIPSSYELEDLIGRIRRWWSRSSSSSSPSSGENPLSSIFLEGQGAPTQNFFDLLQPGSEIVFNVDSLEDLFIPRVADFAASRGRIRLSWEASQNLRIRADRLDLSLEPMDYPAGEGAERPPFHLLGGRIQEPAESAALHGETVEPGLQILYSPRSGRWRVQFNLSLDLHFQIPYMGEVRGRCDLIGSSQGVLNAQGLRVVPGFTTLQIRNLEVRLQGGERFSAPSQLLVSDDPEELSPFERALSLDSGTPRFVVRGNGSAGPSSDAALLFDARFGIPLNEQGLYDFSHAQNFWETLELNADLFESGHHDRLQFRLNPYLVPGGPRGYDGHFDLWRDAHPIVQGGRLFAQSERGGEGEWNLAAGFEASRIEFLDLRLQRPGFYLQTRIHSRPSEGWEAVIPLLQFRANPSGSPRGILRGPLLLEQRPVRRGPLALFYDEESNEASLRNLNLRLIAQRILVPGLANLSRETPASRPQLSSLDVDGRLQGNWVQNLSTERGRGELCLVGDSRGDITLRGRRGERIPDPLISDTRWCATSVTRVDRHHDILWGRFFLDTTMDWGLLRYFGLHLNMRERGRMAHDNLPYSPRGYESIEQLFFRRVGVERGRGRRERREEP